MRTLYTNVYYFASEILRFLRQESADAAASDRPALATDRSWHQFFDLYILRQYQYW